MANSVDPDQSPRFAASDLGLHYLHRPVRPNSQGKWVIYLEQSPKIPVHNLNIDQLLIEQVVVP